MTNSGYHERVKFGIFAIIVLSGISTNVLNGEFFSCAWAAPQGHKLLCAPDVAINCAKSPDPFYSILTRIFLVQDQGHIAAMLSTQLQDSEGNAMLPKPNPQVYSFGEDGTPLGAIATAPPPPMPTSQICHWICPSVTQANPKSSAYEARCEIDAHVPHSCQAEREFTRSQFRQLAQRVAAKTLNEFNSNQQLLSITPGSVCQYAALTDAIDQTYQAIQNTRILLITKGLPLKVACSNGPGQTKIAQTVCLMEDAFRAYNTSLGLQLGCEALARTETQWVSAEYGPQYRANLTLAFQEALIHALTPEECPLPIPSRNPSDPTPLPTPPYSNNFDQFHLCLNRNYANYIASGAVTNAQVIPAPIANAPTVLKPPVVYPNACPTLVTSGNPPNIFEPMVCNVNNQNLATPFELEEIGLAIRAALTAKNAVTQSVNSVLTLQGWDQPKSVTNSSQ